MKKYIPLSLFVFIAIFVSLSFRSETQPPDLHGSCVYAVQEWHNPEYIEFPYCYQARARILQKPANTDISPQIYQPAQVLVQKPVFTPPTVAPTKPPVVGPPSPVIQPTPNPTQPPVVTPPPTQPPPPPPTEPPVVKQKCNNGSGNGAEGCSPGKGNDDETP